MEKKNTMNKNSRIKRKINGYRKIVIYFTIFYIILDVIYCIVTFPSFTKMFLSFVDIAIFIVFIYALNNKVVGIVEIMFLLCCLNLAVKAVILVIAIISLSNALSAVDFIVYAFFFYYVCEVRKYLKKDEVQRLNNGNNATKPENVV